MSRPARSPRPRRPRARASARVDSVAVVAPAAALRFGPSGIPRSSARPGTPHGIRRVRELGLDHLEMAWVNGVRMSDASADAIAAAARACDVTLTAHGPYYVNLCGDADVTRRSIERLVETGRLAARCGAASFCFHAGFYGGQPPREAMRRVREALGEVAARVRDLGARVDIRPELTGKPSQVGSLEEILELSEAVPSVAPCVDFSHQYARDGGRTNSEEAFGAMLDTIARRLGRAALERLHVHLSGIEYGPKGERRHEPLARTRFRWRDVLRALRARGVGGWVVSESPEMEDDALRLRRAHRRLA